MKGFLPVSCLVYFASLTAAQILIQGEPENLSPLFGGKEDADINRKDVKDIADFATESLAVKKNGAVDLVKVVKAQTQVVSGVNYFLTIQIKPTGCNDNCKYEQCDVTVYEQSWTDTREVKHSACKEVTPPSGTLGGQQVSLEDKDVMSAVNFAVEEINKRSNSLYRSNFIKLENAYKQLVAGWKYKLTMVMGDTVCKNSPGHMGSDLKACPLSDPQKTQICNATVWFQDFRTEKYKLLNFKCDKKQASSPLLGHDKHDFCHGGMFRDFQKEHGKTYPTAEEEQKRFGIFCENVKKAAEYQSKDQGTARYGVTQFSDLTEAEFKSYLSKPWDLSPMADMKRAPSAGKTFPTSFDWRDHGAVTPVKNQGSCGSCWAFSTTGNIEGMWYNKKQRLVSLSEQELVDCDKVDQGCEGGLPANAYKQIIKLGGLETESEYKYQGRDGKCQFVKSDVRVYINSSVAISSDEDEMAAWLSKNGPISIGINAAAMQFYFGGISHPWKIFCNPSSLDHGVLIVGYGKQGNKPFWIIKNSWGPRWGEKGYYYVYRGAGVCGLNRACTSAIIDG